MSALSFFNPVTRDAIREIFNNPCEGFKCGMHLDKFFSDTSSSIINEVFFNPNTFDGWLINDFSQTSELVRSPDYEQIINLMQQNIYNNFENLYKSIDDDPFTIANKCSTLVTHLIKSSTFSISAFKFNGQSFPNEANVNMAEYIFMSKLIFAWITSTEPNSNAEFQLDAARYPKSSVYKFSLTSFMQFKPNEYIDIATEDLNKQFARGILLDYNVKYMYSPFIVKSITWDMLTEKTKQTIKNISLFDVLHYLYNHDIQLSKGCGAISMPLAILHGGTTCNFETLIQGYRYILWKHFREFGFKHKNCDVREMQSFLNDELSGQQMSDYCNNVFYNAFTESNVSLKVFDDSGFMYAVYASFLNLPTLSAYTMMHLFNRIPFTALWSEYKQTILLNPVTTYGEVTSKNNLLTFIKKTVKNSKNSMNIPIVNTWNLSCMLQYNYYVLPPWPFKLGHNNLTIEDLNFDSLDGYMCIGVMNPTATHAHTVFFAPNNFELKDGNIKQEFKNGFYQLDHSDDHRITPLITDCIVDVPAITANESYYEHTNEHSTGYKSIFKGGALDILVKIIAPLLMVIIITAIVIAVHNVYQNAHSIDLWQDN